MSELDEVLHRPARLQIVAVLAKVDDIEFATLRDIVAVSDSVLSKHLSSLVDAGYAKLSKAKQDGRQRTWAALTRKGKRAFASHMRALAELVEQAEAAIADELATE